MKYFFQVRIFTVLSLLLFVFAGAVHAQRAQNYTYTGNPTDALQIKINEVVTLKISLEKKRMEMQAARQDYQKEIVSYKNEITEEKYTKNINNYSQAQKNKRIKNNLSLIQRHLAYIDKIDKLEDTLSQGIEELLYLERKAKADLKIVKLLDSNDELVRKIDNSLKQYAPHASKFVLDSKQLKFTPLQKIWQEMAPEEEKPAPKEAKSQSPKSAERVNNEYASEVITSENQTQQFIGFVENQDHEKGIYIQYPTTDHEIFISYQSYIVLRTDNVPNQILWRLDGRATYVPHIISAHKELVDSIEYDYTARINPAEIKKKFTVAGKWFWRQTPHNYGHFVLVRDGYSYRGTLDDEGEGTYGDVISHVVVSGDRFIRFKRNGRYGIQYWEGEFKEVSGKLIIVKGRWQKINGSSGYFFAEKKD